MRRRDDPVIDCPSLRHVLEILLLQAELAVLVQHELDRLAVILLHQILEADQGAGEGVVVVELDRTVEGDGLRLRTVHAQGEHGTGRQRGQSTSKHGGPPWLAFLDGRSLQDRQSLVMPNASEAICARRRHWLREHCAFVTVSHLGSI